MRTGRILIFCSFCAFLLLAGCADPGANSPPTASITDFVVTGAGTAAVNGEYREFGTSPDLLPTPRYINQNGYQLFAAYENYTDRYWAIDMTQQNSVADPAAAFSYISGITDPGSLPPSTGWIAGTLTGPPSSVSRSAITGVTSTIGNTLTAHYTFSDPEGDGDASEYQWYRSNSSTDTTGGTAIPGATGITFDTTGADDNTYLRFKVTPVDDLGNRGTPVISGPSFKINGGS